MFNSFVVFYVHSLTVMHFQFYLCSVIYSYITWKINVIIIIICIYDFSIN